MTKIGTPANQRMMSRNMVRLLHVDGVVRRRWSPKSNLAGMDLSRWSPPFIAAHHAAPSESTRLAAVTKPVRIAARLALSAAWRAALTASLTRLSASCWRYAGPLRHELHKVGAVFEW